MPKTQNIEYKSVWKDESGILVLTNQKNIEYQNEQQ